LDGGPRRYGYGGLRGANPVIEHDQENSRQGVRVIGVDINIQKMSPASLAAFGLGWYVSDTLTRDEKQKWQRQMEEEFNRSIKNQDDAKKARDLERSRRRLKKSAYGELQEYYQERMK